MNEKDKKIFGEESLPDLNKDQMKRIIFHYYETYERLQGHINAANMEKTLNRMNYNEIKSLFDMIVDIENKILTENSK